MFIPNHRTFFLAVLLAVASLIPARMNAQLDRSRPPQPGPAPTVRIGEHTTITLPNGMHLIVVEDHKLPMVSVQVRFDIPAVQQGERAGFVELFGELLTTGTAERNKADLDKAVDALGASLNANHDGLFATVLKKNLEPLLEVIGEVVTEPAFPAEEVGKAVHRARSGVQQRREEPEAIAETVGRAITFGRTHPYGEVATEKTLGRVGRDALLAYHRHFFRPENAYLVFVGDITEKEARALAREVFGKWAPPSSLVTKDELGRTMLEGFGALMPVVKPNVPSGVRRVYMVDRPGAAQSVIRVVFPLGLLPKDIRAMQAQVMNTILGGGIFNARLMQNLRERHGYTYGAYSSLDIDRTNSSFSASVSVRTAVTDSAVAEILFELDRIRQEGVSTEELELARNSMMGTFGRSLEDPRTVAAFALNVDLNDLAPDHYSTYLSRLEHITPEQVQEAATAFLFPEQAAILVVGDMAAMGEKLARFNAEVDAPVVRLTEDGEIWQEVLTPVTDRTAEQIIEAYLHAIGGREAIAKLRRLRIQRTVQGSDAPYTLTEWFAPEQYRSRLMQGVELREEYIHDGKRATFTDGSVSGEITDAGYETVRSMSDPVPEMHYGRNLEEVRLLGMAKWGEREVYKLLLRTRAGTSSHAYFDKATGLKLRMGEEILYNGRSYARIVEFDDLRPINGVLFPHRITERGGPGGASVRTITAVGVDEPTSAGYFDVVIPEVPDSPVPPELPVEEE